MKKIIILTALILFLIAGCAQQPAAPIEPTTPTEEPILEEPSQICTERWLCQDQNTKAYRKSDCTFEQITDKGFEQGITIRSDIYLKVIKEAKELIKSIPVGLVLPPWFNTACDEVLLISFCSVYEFSSFFIII